MRLQRLKITTWRLAIALSALMFCGVFPVLAEQSVLQSMEKEFQAIVRSVRPSVVEIIATCEVREPNVPLKRGKVLVEEQESVYHLEKIGSGIVIDSAGHIVTTSMVVENAKQIEVELADGQRYRAKLLGIDSMTDLAVLVVESDMPPQTKIGDSDGIDAGSWVVTVGSSYGHSPTLSFGIVSGREILPSQPFYEAIKINAAVNPGNSGGAVVNTSGELIGIIAATLAEPYFPRRLTALNPASPELGTENALTNPLLFEDGIWMGQEIGFAVPIKDVQAIAEQIIQHGRVPRGWLGVRTDGVRVTEVMENSPAQKAGILPQDVIAEFNNTPVTTFLELKKLVANSAPNTRVTIKIQRGNISLKRDVILGESR